MVSSALVQHLPQWMKHWHVVWSTSEDAPVDFGGRSALIFHADFKRADVGDLSTEMIPHFFQSFAEHAKANLHLEVLYGSNTHHKIEALFKAFALSCREAIKLDPAVKGIPSTKGLLETSRKKKK